MPKCVSYPHATLFACLDGTGCGGGVIGYVFADNSGGMHSATSDKRHAGFAMRTAGVAGICFSTQIDFVCSGIVAKTDGLLALQEWAKSLIPTDSNSRVVTGTGES